MTLELYIPQAPVPSGISAIKILTMVVQKNFDSDPNEVHASKQGMLHYSGHTADRRSFINTVHQPTKAILGLHPMTKPSSWVRKFLD
jgi:hypothetical protein